MKILTVALDNELDEYLEMEKSRYGTPVAEVIRRALYQFKQNGGMSSYAKEVKS